ncbi:HTH_Tnp_Tc3_2 domain-containing protein [Trichonephila clavipes]|nr:HTH_Tnp_Tc3_2 domain-containing protein [Trichonephila clavipes]
MIEVIEEFITISNSGKLRATKAMQLLSLSLTNPILTITVWTWSIVLQSAYRHFIHPFISLQRIMTPRRRQKKMHCLSLPAVKKIQSSSLRKPILLRHNTDQLPVPVSTPLTYSCSLLRLQFFFLLGTHTEKKHTVRVGAPGKNVPRPRGRSRNAYQHVSDFDKGRIVAYRNGGLLYHSIGACVGQDPMTVTRIWNRWVQDDNTERRGGSQRPPITSSREDIHVTRKALMKRTAKSRALRQELGSFARQQMSARTIR